MSNSTKTAMNVLYINIKYNTIQKNGLSSEVIEWKS